MMIDYGHPSNDGDNDNGKDSVEKKEDDNDDCFVKDDHIINPFTVCAFL